MRSRRATKCLTLSAMLVALGSVILIIGAYIDVMSMTVAAACSLIMVLVYIELGSPYTWLVWLATTLVTVIFAIGSVVWVEYLLVFGIYPIIKGYLEKLTRPLWIPVKFIVFNVQFWALFAIEEFIFGVPFFEFEAVWLKAVVYLLALIVFFVYDYFIAFMANFYLARFHARVQRYLNG